MFRRKKKNPFDSMPYHLRATCYNALTKYSRHLFRELDKNGAFDDDGNFVSDNDWECDMYSEMKSVDGLVEELFKLSW
jgi:hypothetical protein